MQLLFRCDTSSNEFNHSLRRLAIPNTYLQLDCNLGKNRNCNLPSHAMTRNSSSGEISCVTTSGNAVTICCSGERSALFLNSKSPRARERARLPLTRPKSTNPPAAQILAFSPTSRQLDSVSSSHYLLAFVLWLVIKRQGFCSPFYTQDGP